MLSSKSYLVYILDQLSGVPEITCRPMMGEYLLYAGGKLIGGLYDDRLLLKPTDAVRSLLPDARTEKPYDGGRDMLLVEDTDDRELLTAVVLAAAEALPEQTRRSRKKKTDVQSNDRENQS